MGEWVMFWLRRNGCHNKRCHVDTDRFAQVNALEARKQRKPSLGAPHEREGRSVVEGEECVWMIDKWRTKYADSVISQTRHHQHKPRPKQMRVVVGIVTHCVFSIHSFWLAKLLTVADQLLPLWLPTSLDQSKLFPLFWMCPWIEVTLKTSVQFHFN